MTTKPPAPSPKLTNKMSNSDSTRKRRAWPAKRRAMQAKNCRKTQPWEHTTGPRTAAGKEAVKNNALKHGLRTAEITELRRLLRVQKAFIRAVTLSTGS